MYRGQKVIGIIVAAGKGSRMGFSLPKQFLKIGGSTMIEETGKIFEKNRYVDGFFVVSAPEYVDYVRGLFSENVKLIDVVEGGASRQESVRNALGEIQEECLILVHDGARPYLDDETVEKVLEGAFEFGAAVPVVELEDTVKSVVCTKDYKLFVKSTVDRDSLRRVQTPQGFKSELIKKAHKMALEMGIEGTDDACLVEAMGEIVAAVRGSGKNIKITRKEDMPGENRIGNGFDVHNLIEGRPLIIGGENIPYHKGLEGHSDADVLVHAIMDSLLGAANLGDIGGHFSDKDPKYKGVNSIELLKKVWELLEGKGYEVVNIDSVIMCQEPKLMPYIEAMKQNIAEALFIGVDRVSIKATTTEKLGFVGRQEGIAASSVCLLKFKNI